MPPADATCDGEQYDGDYGPQRDIGEHIGCIWVNPKLADGDGQRAFVVTTHIGAMQGDLRLCIIGLPRNIAQDVIDPKLTGLYHMAGNRLLVMCQLQRGGLLGGGGHIINHYQPNEALWHNDLGVGHGPAKYPLTLWLVFDAKKINQATIVANINAIEMTRCGAKYDTPQRNKYQAEPNVNFLCHEKFWGV